MELFRALGALAEPPTPAAQRVADALDLGRLPAPEAHTDLFAFQLYPYASVYLGAEGMLGGEARDRIAGFWRALGLTPPAEPDHLPLMLAFYAELAARGARDSRAERAAAAFLDEHLLSWLPPFLARCEELADGFYRRWAGMLGAALRDAAAHRPPAAELPLHLRVAPPMVDPRRAGEDGETFLTALLAPARSGLVLVRDDLSRAADELGLGARIGERRFVLRALLGQAPAATLDWLATEAARQAALPARAGARGGEEPAADFWRRRATATARLLGQLAAARRAEDPAP